MNYEVLLWKFCFVTNCNFKIRENLAKTELICLQNTNFKKRHIQYILCLAWFSAIGSLQWTSGRLSTLSIVIQNSIILRDIEEKLGRILKKLAKLGKIQQNLGKFGKIRQNSGIFWNIRIFWHKNSDSGIFVLIYEIWIRKTESWMSKFGFVFQNKELGIWKFGFVFTKQNYAHENLGITNFRKSHFASSLHETFVTACPTSTVLFYKNANFHPKSD